MALDYVQPSVPADSDLVTCKEAVRLFAQTGHDVSRSTVRRWVTDRELERKKIGKEVFVSYSDLLVAHADWVGDETVP